MTTVKIPWPNIGDSMFAAFKWNNRLIKIYETIFRSLRKKYKNLIFQYGSRVLPVEEKSSGVTEFINRNKQLYDIFVAGIESSDIFIADITGQNPNVMLELGIAMKLNKNVLILKEKGSEEKYPFNIQSVQINKYASVVELEKIIFEFIETYSKIRNQTFDDPLPERYTKIDKINLIQPRNFITHRRFPKGVKNLKIRFQYNFLSYVHLNDWIGIHIRTQGPERNNSELIYSRVNGELESLSWPAHKAQIEGISETSPKNNFFDISIIESELTVSTNSKKLVDDNVFADGFGDILIGIWDHPEYEGAFGGQQLKVECTNFEIINLDTTAPL